MSKVKRLTLFVVLVIVINLIAGDAIANPIQISCSSLKPSATVNINCYLLTQSYLIKPTILDSASHNLFFVSEIFRGSSINKMGKDISDIVSWAAQKVGLSPALVGAVAQAESGGNQVAVSPVGAIGVMQLMPETANGLGVNPYVTEQNVLGGARYLRKQVDHFGGDIPKALAAYNAGPGAVEKHGGIPPYKETRDFVTRVMILAGGSQ